MEVVRRHGAALALTVAAPVAVWFLIGQLREGNGADYIFRIPEMNRSLEVGLGLVALAAAMGGAVRLHRDGRLRRGGRWRVYLQSLSGGVLFAVGLRIVTAASAGANIGGGMAMFFGPPIALYLCNGARINARQIRETGSCDALDPPEIALIAAGLAGAVLMALDFR